MVTSPSSRPSLHRIEDPISKSRLKEPFTWGWVIYRCSYSDEDAWQKMIEILLRKMTRGLEVEKRMDLLPYHEMTIMDDKARFDGATSHDIRDHFGNWVADTLKDKLVIPPTELELQLIRQNYSADHAPEWSFGARYNFCIFTDDICLESLKHMTWPVIKLLGKPFGAREPRDRDYVVYPGWEDGDTDCEDEDVGWIYIEAMEYLTLYEMLVETHNWYNQYCRPPFMWNTTDRSRAPGY